MRSFRTLVVGGILAASAAACSDQDATLARPDRGDARAPVLSAMAGRQIAGQYIVVLQENANPRWVAGQAGVNPRYVYSGGIRGFAARLTQGQLNALRNDPDVAYIEEDQVVTLSTTQSPATWGLDRVDQRDLPLNNAYNYTPTGAGVRAYIVDTGIRTTHTNFGGRASIGRDFIGDGSTDCNGHGTHVAGTVGSTTYGVAKGVTLIGVRVFACGNSGSTSTIIAGIDWVTANAIKPAVANMSLGAGASTAMDAAVRNLAASGVVAVVAAGNENQNACNVSPARVAEAITVGSTTSTDARSSFSNWGSCLDLFAPGSSITSTWYTSNTATNTIGGTSMASPHVAGVAALYLQGTPSATPAAVANAIITTTTANKVTSAGTGSPNRLLFSLLTGTTPPPPPPPTGTTYTGFLSGAGDSDDQPNGTYYQSTVSGTHLGVLDGPTGADFDLYLYKWNGFSWSIVARAETAAPDETINYSGTAGYYIWEIYAYSGSGS
ncbi:MAG TPA: S8 family peptidase, partial [Longimicrobiaceae bacterium]|nr:S8 family peptidase [Longimicrobiaceae bacterium]